MAIGLCDLLQLWPQTQHIACGQPGIEESRDGAAFHRVGCNGGRFRFLRLPLSIAPQSFVRLGRNGHRLVISKAVRNSPVGLRPFFEGQSRDPLSDVTDPLDAIGRLLRSAHNHFILLDKYGRFPFEACRATIKPPVNKIRQSETGC